MEIFKDLIQGSDEWLEKRAGVITGTKLAGIMGGPASQLTTMYELIGEEFAPLEPIYKSNAMDRGTELEPLAKVKYIEVTGEKVIEVGFIKLNSFTGLSPDGIIYSGDKINKAIEIKCPGSKNFVKYILENTLPKDYEWQVVMYFITIEDLQELDFIIYNPDFYITEKRLHIIKIKKEHLKDKIEKAKERLEEFRIEWLKSIQTLLKK